MASTSTQRRRRIRQLEHCNPAVFGDVCLTPYQNLHDLNNLHGVQFLNIEMASASSSITSINKLKNTTSNQLQWINGQALILKNIRSSYKNNCQCHLNQNYLKNNLNINEELTLINHERKGEYFENTYCEECKNGECSSPKVRENGDGAFSDDGEYINNFDYTNDTYYNLDFTMLEKRRCSVLVDQLLLEIYSTYQAGITDYNSGTSCKSTKYIWMDRHQLSFKAIDELIVVIDVLQKEVVRAGNLLVRRLKRRDALGRQKDARCDVINCLLRKIAENSSLGVPEFSPEMRFSLQPLPGDSGFTQWHSAMKMVSQLPEGIPPEFRRQLWLSLADKHLQAKGVDWSVAERDCFNEWSHPADAELGVQIVKDLHRTGCSLFCGKDGKENQALLKRVLLAYARWNKNVGYCQGFNMLAALILQVTEKSEVDALKLMIYLIEGVLPDSYFADSLRGLSVDMAVFRELLRTKLPKLSKHLDTLQVASKEGTTSYEPPLTNVFTMQWFLTLFCNCLPQPTVLRVWDLILLEGNEILLRTSLAIWQVLADRIMTAKTADEFYCVMGMLMREILEFDLIDANTLVKGIVSIGPLTELSALREHYLYNINPWGAAPTNRETPPDGARRNRVHQKDKLVLDIGVLKKQYTKLKQRQRQAHVIFNTAVARQTARPAPVAMNHLLLGKSALVPAKKPARAGPPKGAVPPPRHTPHKQSKHTQQSTIKSKVEKRESVTPSPKTLHWKDEDVKKRSSSSSSSSSDTELCDEPEEFHSDEDKHSVEKTCQLPELPDDNLVDHKLATPEKSAPINSTANLYPTQPDLTFNKNSDNSDNHRSDIDVEVTLTPDPTLTDLSDVSDIKYITNINNEICAIAPLSSPQNVIPDLLDFVEPSLVTPTALTFNIDYNIEFLTSSINEDQLNKPNEEIEVLNQSPIYPSMDGATEDYFLTLNENLQLQRSDSLPSEDGFDFEKFLEERVKSLKDIKDLKDNKEKIYSSEESLDDTSETERIKYARKNSVRALEIIQENSLILHRILQCQSRLTPTPPPDEDSEIDTSEYNDIVCTSNNALLEDIISPSTPTPTNENQTALVLPSELPIRTNCDEYGLLSCHTDEFNATNEELKTNDCKTPEKLNVFRPYGDFSEFLSQYKSKTPDIEKCDKNFEEIVSSELYSDENSDCNNIKNNHENLLLNFDDVQAKVNSESNFDIQNYELQNKMLDVSKKNTSIFDETNATSGENDMPSFNTEFEVKFPENLGLSYTLDQTDDNNVTCNNEFTALVYENSIKSLPNIDIDITNVSMLNIDNVEVRRDVDIVEKEDDDATYLNRLISKYNFISKQHEDGSPLDVKEKMEKDERAIAASGKNDIDGYKNIEDGNGFVRGSDDMLNIEDSIKAKSTKMTTFQTAPLIANIVEVDYNLEKYRHKLGSPLSEINEGEMPKSSEENVEVIEIDKNSKYNSILEYSRNLDEKFNNLILKSPKLSKLHSENSRLGLKANFSLDIPDKVQHNIMNDKVDENRSIDNCENFTNPEMMKTSRSFQDFTAIDNVELYERPDHLNLSPSTNAKMASSSKRLIMTTEVDQQEDVASSYSSSKNTMDVDILLESPSLKSPNRIYNPFPVSISSRQSKEVPFRLGLYKK